MSTYSSVTRSCSIEMDLIYEGIKTGVHVALHRRRNIIEMDLIYEGIKTGKNTFILIAVLQ